LKKLEIKKDIADIQNEDVIAKFIFKVVKK